VKKHNGMKRLQTQARRENIGGGRNIWPSSARDSLWPSVEIGNESLISVIKAWQSSILLAGWLYAVAAQKQ